MVDETLTVDALMVDTWVNSHMVDETTTVDNGLLTVNSYNGWQKHDGLWSLDSQVVSVMDRQ